MPYEEITATPAASSQQNEVAVTGDLDATLPQTVLHLGSGRTVVLPTELLLGGLPRQKPEVLDGLPGSTAVGERELTIPLVAEQARIGSRP